MRNYKNNLRKNKFRNGSDRGFQETQQRKSMEILLITIILEEKIRKK